MSRAPEPKPGPDPFSRRVLGEVRRIDYDATRAFFDGRARRAADQPALTAVLYQDANPDLARRRDEMERDMVLGWLALDGSQRVLDIGCGIGRWGQHVAPGAGAYQGIDFSAGLVDLAGRAVAGLYPEGRWAVDLMSATELAPDRLTLPPPFDVVIQAGLLVYLNDDDAEQVLGAIPSVASEHAVLYLREPVATGERLTLDRHWSEELEQEYSASYRPVEWYEDRIRRTLGASGFEMTRSVGLDPGLANRRETAQHFFLLER